MTTLLETKNMAAMSQETGASANAATGGYVIAHIHSLCAPNTSYEDDPREGQRKERGNGQAGAAPHTLHERKSPRACLAPQIGACTTRHMRRIRMDFCVTAQTQENTCPSAQFRRSARTRTCTRTRARRKRIDVTLLTCLSVCLFLCV